MQVMTEAELNEVAGAMDGWGFAGAVMAIGAGAIAVATAPVWGAVGGLLAIGAVGANAMSQFSA